MVAPFTGATVDLDAGGYTFDWANLIAAKYVSIDYSVKTIDGEVVDKLKAIDGVLKVRIIK